ncbi:MAG TPA: hypothetical protein EYQ63_03750 [Fuerstia sp.]|nr:hypothetical protein [Fuerstiella sp.]
MKSLYGIVLFSLLITLSCTGVVCGPRAGDYVNLIVKNTLVEKAYYEGQLAFINSASRHSNPYWESDEKQATEWDLGWKERCSGRIANVVRHRNTSRADEAL